jgi:hypothetical protein
MFEVAPLANANGTSFHGNEIEVAPFVIQDTFGSPCFTGSIDEKVQMEWLFVDEEGRVFTLYDWKQYTELDALTPIPFHIGSRGEGEEEFLSWLKFELGIEEEVIL